MQINLRQLIVPAGHQVLLEGVSWEDFEQIIEEFGPQRNAPRISYSKGYLELMSPLAVHEFDKEFIKKLHILILQQGVYRNSDRSLQFPQFEIKQLIPDYLEKAKTEGRNKAIKAFRRYVQPYCK